MVKALGSVLSRFFRKNVGMTVDIFYMYAKETPLIPVLTFENCLESMASDYFSCLVLSDQKGGLLYFSVQTKSLFKQNKITKPTKNGWFFDIIKTQTW